MARLVCVATLLLFACGDDGDGGTPDGGNPETANDPASTVHCTGAMRFPSIPIVPNAGGELAVTDFNGDGLDDFVTIGAYGMYVFLRTGDATFGVPTQYSVSLDGYDELKIVDVNNDGHPDITTGHRYVFLNVGDGTFTKSGYADNGPTAFGDVTGDGRTDMMVMETSNGSLRLWANNGAGFAAPTTIATNIANVGDFELGDLNSDGRADLVLTTYGAINVLLNNGSGGFAAATSYPSTPTGEQNNLAIADINNDGKRDIALLTTAGNVAQGTVYLNQGGGVLGPSLDVQLPLATTLTRMAVADVDGDGDRDLAFSLQGTVAIVRFMAPAQLAQPLLVYTAAESAAFGDFNGDGRPDMVSGIEKGPANLFLNDGSPDLYARRTALRAPQLVGDLAVADVDNDHEPDLVTLETGSVSVRQRAADGSLAPPTDYALAAEAYEMAVFDANGDGRVDVFAAGEQAELLTNTTTGLGVTTSFATAGLADHIATADIDHDGVIDVVISTTVIGMSGSTITLFKGRADGTFDPAVHVADYYSIYALALFDLDGDGRVDLLVSGANAAQEPGLHTHKGLGDGTFATASRYQGRGLLGSIFLRDVDGDGTKEVLIPGVDGISVLRSDASLNVSEVAFTARGGGYEAALADFNGDGHLDVVSFMRGGGYGTYGTYVSISFGNGDGTFAESISYEGLSGPIRSVKVADLDGDGIVDIATSGATLGTLNGETGVLYGRCL